MTPWREQTPILLNPGGRGYFRRTWLAKRQNPGGPVQVVSVWRMHLPDPDGVPFMIFDVSGWSRGRRKRLAASIKINHRTSPGSTTCNLSSHV